MAGHSHGHDHHGHGHHDHDHDHGHGMAATIEPILDPAQESLVQALHSGFWVLRIIMVVLIVAYLLSGAYKVESGEQWLVVRLGKLVVGADGSPVIRSGVHFGLPDPFDQKIKLPGAQNRLTIDSFSFKRRDEDRGKSLAESTPASDVIKAGEDGAMITGDKNLSHGIWTVEYVIRDGKQFVTNVGESTAAFEPLLRSLAQTAIVHATAGRRVEEVTRTASVVSADVRLRLQKLLDKLQCGVDVNNVIAETIEPQTVKAAFSNATAALSERDRAVQQAQQQANETLNQAAGTQHEGLLRAIEEYGAAQATKGEEKRLQELRESIESQLATAGGEVARALQEADGRANEILGAVRREFDEYKLLIDDYRRDPEVIALRIWVRMRDEVLSGKKNEMFYVPHNGVLDIQTNRDPVRTFERDRQDYLDRKNRQP